MTPTRRNLGAGLAALSVTALMARPAADAKSPRPFAWPKGARAAVSLTYDDGLNSQLANAAPDLDAFGFKATFFLTQENMDARLADWQALERRGHEMADHTISHPCDSLVHETAADFARKEVDPMEKYLDDHFQTPRPRSFAYPCGFTGLGHGPLAEREARYLSVLRPRLLAARTVEGPPNDPRLLSRDRFRLNAFEPTYDHDDPRPAFAYVRKAIQQGGWAILVFHEILPARKGEGDTSQRSHHAILAWLAGQPVWCAPMREVFEYATAKGATDHHKLGGLAPPS
jgi:peptidoglycan/xylan/chitin deacetylase (PgdA/CDA1 family)